MMRRASVTLLLCASAATAATAAAQPASLAVRMIHAEDARAQTDADLATLRQGLASRDPKLRQQAVRGIGRLERPELIGDLTRALADDNAGVRAAAANAIGQSAKGAKGVADAKARLLVRVRAEQDPEVWGVVVATLGRLAYTQAADVDQVERVLATVLPSPASTAIQIDALLGAVEGLEALARQSGKISRLKESTLAGLRAASALQGRAADADKLRRVRRLATLALTTAGVVQRPQLEAGIADEDDEVRRLTMVAARGEIDGREAIVRRGLTDDQARVRYEALQAWGRGLQTTSCDPVIAAVRDPNPHVSLLAIDLLGNGCPAAASAAAALQPLAEVLTTQPGRWHAPAHALVSLARVAPELARPMLPRYLAHGTWQVRMYAARAAGVLGAVDELVRLGGDGHDNVREAALAQLVALERPEAVAVALDALARPDYQLIITAAGALAAATDKTAAVEALTRAHQRLVAQGRDTARDPLAALADRLTAFGAPPPAPPARAATAVSVDEAELAALAHTRLRFTMAGRGTFDLQLLPDEAPVTAAHITRLARDGYYNGLTFHRVVPNFVIQGGSPGANEYMGQGPFMRDELGLVPHRRGSVGISTRGRDTGDAQLFIDLVDVPRLDHNYTVFATVVEGMEVVDAILEGDTIERVEVLAGATR